MSAESKPNRFVGRAEDVVFGSRPRADPEELQAILAESASVALHLIDHPEDEASARERLDVLAGMAADLGADQPGEEGLAEPGSEVARHAAARVEARRKAYVRTKVTSRARSDQTPEQRQAAEEGRSLGYDREYRLSGDVLLLEMTEDVERSFFEAGFTGVVTTVKGSKFCFQNGKIVPCPGQTKPQAPPAAPQKPTAAPARPAAGQPSPKAVSAVAKAYLSAPGAKHGLVSLADLHATIGGTLADLHATVNALRRKGVLTAIADDGRFASDPAHKPAYERLLKASMPDPGTTTRLTFVSMKDGQEGELAKLARG